MVSPGWTWVWLGPPARAVGRSQGEVAVPWPLEVPFGAAYHSAAAAGFAASIRLARASAAANPQAAPRVGNGRKATGRRTFMSALLFAPQCHRGNHLRLYPPVSHGMSGWSPGARHCAGR